MAAEYIQGFDTFNTAQLPRYIPTASTNHTIAAGLYGSGGALRWIWNDQLGNIPLTPRASYVLGFDINTAAYYAFFRAIGLTISTATGGTIVTTFGNSAPGVMFVGTTYAVIIKYVISPTAGSLLVRVNGVTVINFTGINTGSTDISYFNLDGTNGQVLDNLYVLNSLGSHSNDIPVGRMSVQTRVPTGDGAFIDLMPSTGTTHFPNVSEIPCNDDGSYNDGITPGSKDTYTLPALTGSIAQVHAIKISCVLRKTDVDRKTAHVICSLGGTLTEGADIDVPLAYGAYGLLFTDNPNTGVQLTAADANNLQPGIKIIV